MGQCVDCGSPVPDGQSVCSMCYGDPGYGSDGYYQKWLDEREEGVETGGTWLDAVKALLRGIMHDDIVEVGVALAELSRLNSQEPIDVEAREFAQYLVLECWP